MRLSIIIPIYNTGKTLEKCVNSVLKQNIDDYEIILVNDGSFDNSLSICRDFEKENKIIKVIDKKNGGLSSARNAGIKEAKGEFVAFIDSDDWVEDRMYEYMLNLQKKHNADIVSVSYVLANSLDEKIVNDKEVIKILNKEEALYNYLYEGMRKRIADFSACNKLYRKELFDSIRFPEGRIYEDTATNFEIISKIKHKYVRSNQKYYYYNQIGSSITRNEVKINDFDLLYATDRIVEISKDYNSKIKKMAIEKHIRSYYSLLIKNGVYGHDEKIRNWKELESNLLSVLRKKYKVLLLSQMPINRKFFIFPILLNYSFFCRTLKLIKKRR